ncbi:hypothetical protein CK203_100355 [Vitis vinifera]|uniref:Retrovirus-related Pol polyprotein from transposon TNT 1-94-like beta-barrel domain-containing protein n=1 Tax=Vitis vinifera TaxID=29760 RepID=A0A438DL24_VITVI|nr:hypothetical protein CK203_100355 [Vitis vinifera]
MAKTGMTVKIVICGRGKFKYIIGEAKAPAPTAPTYKKWFAKNSIVHAWLINSMEPMVNRRYLFLPTAKDVWDTVRRTYSNLGNASQVFEIHSKLKEMKQGTKSVTQYFTDLQDIRGRILSHLPFPTTEEAFAEVCREEKRRKVMLLEEGSPSAPPTESSALATRKTSQPARNNNDSKTPQQGEQMRCNHCNRHGHTRDMCWKIHGKPTNWVPQRQTEGRGCQTQSNQDKEATTENQTSILFSKEQIEQLCHLLNQSPAPSSSTPSLGSCFVAQSGVSNFSLSYAPCPSSTKVKIADGSLSSVAGICSFKVSKDLTLNSVLHVPALKCNLLSISKLNHDNNRVANFRSSMRHFQDLSLGRMIGSARVHEGLYFLEDTENERRQAFGENHDQEARVWDWDTTALPISETPSMSTTSLPKTTAASPITPKFTSSKTDIAATTPITAELTP